MLAKQAATVDAISQGRLIMGLGAGWNRREYDAFGFPYVALDQARIAFPQSGDGRIAGDPPTGVPAVILGSALSLRASRRRLAGSTIGTAVTAPVRGGPAGDR